MSSVLDFCDDSVAVDVIVLLSCKDSGVLLRVTDIVRIDEIVKPDFVSVPAVRDGVTEVVTWFASVIVVLI